LTRSEDGGAVAGRTRKDIEQQSGQPVISPENFKALATAYSTQSGQSFHGKLDSHST